MVLSHVAAGFLFVVILTPKQKKAEQRLLASETVITVCLSCNSLLLKLNTAETNYFALMCHQDVGLHWRAGEERAAQGLLSFRALQCQEYQVRGGSEWLRRRGWKTWTGLSETEAATRDLEWKKELTFSPHLILIHVHIKPNKMN